MIIPLGALRGLILACAAAFGLSICLPFFSVQPMRGDLAPWLHIFKPDLLHATTYSIVGGVGVLLEEKEYFLATVITGFSMVLPVVKLTVFWIEAQEDAGDDESLPLRLTRFAAPYSMLEVFLLAFTVFAVNGLPGESSIDVGAGVWLFSACVLATMLIPPLIRRAHRDRPRMACSGISVR